jgi:uncharacterized protein (TIGR02246 family)
MSGIERLILDLDNAITNKDLDAIRRIYDSKAVFVAQPGQVARGRDEIAKYYSALFGMNIPMSVTTTAVHTLESDGLALLATRWTLEGTTPTGEKASVERTASMVLRKQAGEEWKVYIDNPYGAEVLAMHDKSLHATS